MLLHIIIGSILSNRLCIYLINYHDIMNNELLYNNIFFKNLTDKYKDIILYSDIDTIAFKEINDDIIKIFDDSEKPYLIKNIDKLYYIKNRTKALYYSDGSYGIYGISSRKNEELLKKLNSIGKTRARLAKSKKLLYS